KSRPCPRRLPRSADRQLRPPASLHRTMPQSSAGSRFSARPAGTTAGADSPKSSPSPQTAANTAGPTKTPAPPPSPRPPPSRRPLAILLIVLIGGVALNLTPCVLPMIPINLAIIGAGTQAGIGEGFPSRARGFLLGATYGGAMAFVYGVLGLIVVLTAGTFGT